MARLAIARMRAVALRHGTVDPIEIAKCEAVPIVHRALSAKWKVQALTYPILGRPTIIINRGLHALEERLLICHELTHALFDAPEMAAYLDKLKKPDVRNRQRERRAWDAATWLFVMASMADLGLDWRVADHVWECAYAA